MYRLVRWLTMAFLLLPGSVPAQNICVRQGGREACLVHTMDPIAGAHIWRLWTDNFYQQTVLDTLGADSLCYRLTHFDHYAADDTSAWCQASGFTGEYELQYGWSESDTLLLQGSNSDDNFSFADCYIDSSAGEWVQFSVRFEHEVEPMELELFYRAHVDGYLERWSRIRNTSGIVFPEEDTLFVWHLSSFRRQLDRQDGPPPGWVVNYVTLSEIADRQLPLEGTTFNLTSWTGPFAWCAVTEAGEVADGFLLGLVQPSVGHERPFVFHFEVTQTTPDTLDLTVYNLSRAAPPRGLEQDEEMERGRCVIPQRVPPGMTLENHHAFFMFTDGTLDDASERTHGFIRNHYVPDPPAEPSSFPRTEYLTYFWEYWGFDYQGLMDQADICKGLGIELFVIDANWWRYSLYDPPRDVGNFHCYRMGTGYWVSDSCRFHPQDSTLVDFIAALGEGPKDTMEVGLWVYPASVDTMLFTVDDRLKCWSEQPGQKPCFCEDGDDPACLPWDPAWHTEFYAPGGCNPDRWHECDSMEVYSSECPFVCPDTLNLVELCCAHAEAYEWIRAQMGRLLDPDRYGAQYLKFDGYVHACYSNSHTHKMPLFPGDTDSLRVQDQFDGFYQLLADIQTDYPGVLYEIGWPLGHLATIEDPTSPASILPHHSRYRMETVRTFTLPQYTGCFLYYEPDVGGLPLAHQEATRRYYIRTIMLGPLALSSDLTDWSLAFRQVVDEEITYYKGNRRFILGEAYSVLRQRDFCGNYACSNSWDAVEFLDLEQGDARVSVFRAEHDSTSWIIKLRGLDPDVSYRVDGVDGGPMGKHTGATLMNDGIEVELIYENSSEILELTPQ